jgi:hypothetical protein
LRAAGTAYGQHATRDVSAVNSDGSYATSGISYQHWNSVLPHGQGMDVDPNVTRKIVAVVSLDEQSKKWYHECRLCTENPFDRQRDFKRHFDSKHGGERIECGYRGCTTSFPSLRRDNLSKHLKNVHGLRSIE